MERKIANDFLNIKDSLSVLIIPPDYIYKTNAKTREIENFDDLSERVQDSILYDNSLFIKDVDDSIFFEKYFSGLQNGLINLGFRIFSQDQIVDFMSARGIAFQVAVVQFELEEDIYPYRAEEIFDDTVAYYEDFNLNTVNVNNWYEITKLNDPLAINNLLYASHFVVDELEGRFPAGDANLSTSSLYYDALISAAYLGKELNKPTAQLTTYQKQAIKLRNNIEKFRI